MKTKKTRLIAVLMAIALAIGGLSIQGNSTPAMAAIVDAIPVQIGQAVNGQYNQQSQDGRWIYYSFTTTDEKAFYSVSLNSNSYHSWKVCKETDEDQYIEDEAGTGTIDLGTKLKTNTTYYILVRYYEDDDAEYTFKVDKYTDDIGDDYTSATPIKADELYNYNLENGSDKDCFEFTTGSYDYILSVNAENTEHSVKYKVYKDELQTVEVDGGYGTGSLDLSGKLLPNTKYWIVFSGNWYEDYEPVPYSFRMDTEIYVPAPTIKLKKKSGRKAKLTWSKVKGATGYVVYRVKVTPWDAFIKGGTYKKIKTYKASAKRSYTSGKLAKGYYYYYMVKAYKTYKGKKFFSEKSNEKRIIYDKSTGKGAVSNG